MNRSLVLEESPESIPTMGLPRKPNIMATTSKTTTKKVQLKRFVFIVDSYAGRSLAPQLEKLGLSGKEYHITGSGGSGIILRGPEWIGAEKLLVFMSSFHGSVEPAIDLSKKIKAANPKARIIFRSTEYSDNPVFDQCMAKDFDYSKILAIVKEFLTK